MVKIRGKWWYKEQWYSVCSMHYHHDDNCKLCNSGQWVNVYKQLFSHFIYNLSPSLWKWYVNRKK